MDTAVTAKIIDGDRESASYSYSVKEYADYLIEHQDSSQAFKKAVPLVQAMLTYGKNAAYYFNKTEEKPEDIDLTIPKFTNKVHDTLPADVEFLGATLSLKSQTTLSLYFKSERDLTFSCEGYTTELAHKGQQYALRIRNIAVADLHKPITVKIDDADAVTYSPLTYCYLAQTASDAKLVNTVKALYNYWDEAYFYFNNTSYSNYEEDETKKL